jgi:hypothetical protein
MNKPICFGVEGVTAGHINTGGGTGCIEGYGGIYQDGNGAPATCRSIDTSI